MTNEAKPCPVGDGPLQRPIVTTGVADNLTLGYTGHDPCGERQGRDRQMIRFGIFMIICTRLRAVLGSHGRT